MPLHALIHPTVKLLCRHTLVPLSNTLHSMHPRAACCPALPTAMRHSCCPALPCRPCMLRLVAKHVQGQGAVSALTQSTTCCGARHPGALSCPAPEITPVLPLTHRAALPCLPTRHRAAPTSIAPPCAAPPPSEQNVKAAQLLSRALTQPYPLQGLAAHALLSFATGALPPSLTCLVLAVLLPAHAVP